MDESLTLVVDTNVWLDWLIFDDARVRPLAVALRARRVSAIATPPMLDELEAVLARPGFALAADQREAMLARVRAAVRLSAPAPDCRLPCTDPDDRKFIDLAVAQRADWLLSRDKALLRLRRPAAARFGLRIGPPEAWAAEACL